MLDLGKVNVPLTVGRIRSQRSGAVQVASQYLFVYQALLEYGLANGLFAGNAQAQAEEAQHVLVTPPRPPEGGLAAVAAAAAAAGSDLGFAYALERAMAKPNRQQLGALFQCLRARVADG